MAVRNPSGIFDEVFAEIGDKATPPFVFEVGFDLLYSTPVEAGGLAPERTTINFLYNQLFAIGVDSNRFGGGLAWDTSIIYEVGAIVSGIDPNAYVAKISNTGVIPAQGSSEWTILRSGDALKDPNGANLIGYFNIDIPTVTTVKQALDFLVNDTVMDEIAVSSNIVNGGVLGTSRGIDTVTPTISGVDITFLAAFTDNQYRVTTTCGLGLLATSPGLTVANFANNFSGSISILISSYDVAVGNDPFFDPNTQFYIEIKHSLASVALIREKKKAEMTKKLTK
ncbi:MAG: hypothetical protein V3V61_01245, partial [Gammaproteobacteria bacterium]